MTPFSLVDGRCCVCREVPRRCGQPAYQTMYLTAQEDCSLLYNKIFVSKVSLQIPNADAFEIHLLISMMALAYSPTDKTQSLCLQ